MAKPKKETVEETVPAPVEEQVETPVEETVEETVPAPVEEQVETPVEETVTTSTVCPNCDDSGARCYVCGGKK